MMLLYNLPFDMHNYTPERALTHILRLKIVSNYLLVAILGFFALAIAKSSAQPADVSVRIVKLEGTVTLARAGDPNWIPAALTNVLRPHDQLRTGPNSAVSLIWPQNSVVPLGPSSQIEVLPPDARDAEPGLYLARGILSFFHRDQPGHIRVITRAAVAGVDGTEFVLQVDNTDRAILSVIDGRVTFGSPQTALLLTNGDQAVATPGQPPVRSPGFIANNILQWSFYYPAVVDPADLTFSAADQQTLANSLNAYRSGNLLAALAEYPAARQPASDDDRVYHAALLLSVGEVDGAQSNLDALTGADATARPQRLASALRKLIAAVKRQPPAETVNPQTASDFLAESYYQQSLATGDASLNAALAAARQAETLAPQSGFAWERIAELEFGFGHTAIASDALRRSLDLAPSNAEALTLRGFLLAAQDRTRDAIASFDQALAIDPGLGNAWLGRGLCRIHLGDAKGGREDLLVAAAAEPQRSPLRSYLGKAEGDAGDFPRATNEFRLAEGLDTNDPTPWLYSALLNQENRRINQAIYDLEKSQELNTNRAIYRSKLLLDQDAAVRSANLAAMYRDAGMFQVATDEAGRAVNEDYANYSAHLFLANTYQSLDDPNGINVRYETPSGAEFLVANLLAPVNAGPLSATISQQEYSPLFEHNQVGVTSSTEYLSRGAWTESGAAYATTDTSSVDFESYYRWDPGQQTNSDITQRQFLLQLKQKLTARDTIFVQAQEYESASGDQFPIYNPDTADPYARETEKQQPIAGIGYHHEWSPGIDTLFYATRLDDTFTLTNQNQPVIVAFRPSETNAPVGLGWDLVDISVIRLTSGWVVERG